MTRREAVRVLLFTRAVLAGGGGAVRCAVVDLSAVGARLSLTASLPVPPLTLEFDLGGEPLELAVEVQRAVPGEHVAVAFVDPPVDQLHRLIAIEQRLALSAGRVNVRERRSRRRRGRPSDEPRSQGRGPSDEPRSQGRGPSDEPRSQGRGPSDERPRRR